MKRGKDRKAGLRPGAATTIARYLSSVSIGLIFLVGLGACSSFGRLDHLALTRKDLPDYGVSLSFPAEWSVKRGDFFHLESRSVRPPELRALFEYRGLEKIKKDRESKRQYAAGWYRAIALSYEGWRYDLQETDGSDPEGTFRFEGTYVDEHNGSASVQLRKIGILRFRGTRLHALYYTAPESEFERLRPLFEKMDRQHRYFKPVN
ncbi:MAG: hypothetical protein RIF32_18255 [Leptospirales bacterium]|jgi:hypothetical protein